jgi:hypothetical protein
MLFLAKELGKTLEELMQISTLEFTMWAAYYSLEAKERQKQKRAGQNGRKYSR